MQTGMYGRVKASDVPEDMHPYVVFLPTAHKGRILSSIFGSKAAVDILRFALSQGVSRVIYQRDLVRKLDYSNKTIIETLKSLTRFGLFGEEMEKTVKEGRTVWVKAYQLSDAGKWFALLLAEKEDLSTSEKADILQNAFRSYLRWVRTLSEDLRVDRQALEKIFNEEMKKA